MVEKGEQDMDLEGPVVSEKIITKVLSLLRKETKKFVLPAIDQIVIDYGRDPFLILISCLLSLRAKDTISVVVSRQLFKRARTPQEILAIPERELERIFHSVGFYKAKTKIVLSVCREIMDRFRGKVPTTEQELLSITGVGPKTAHAVLGYAYGVPVICVDTHVHKIANRLGWVKSTTPNETEEQLKKLIPQRYWIELNRLFVMWGQNICTSISPFCSRCVLADLCPRINVRKYR
jgi:endonuclease-3